MLPILGIQTDCKFFKRGQCKDRPDDAEKCAREDAHDEVIVFHSLEVEDNLADIAGDEAGVEIVLITLQIVAHLPEHAQDQPALQRVHHLHHGGSSNPKNGDVGPLLVECSFENAGVGDFEVDDLPLHTVFVVAAGNVVELIGLIVIVGELFPPVDLDEVAVLGLQVECVEDDYILGLTGVGTELVVGSGF